MSDQDAARDQAQREHDQNQGWAQTNTWDANVRNAYEAERERLRQQQEEENRKRNSGY
ncbi:MAG: hypothetical protein WBQ94_17265 [Terracidiphilus sp.]